MSRLVKGKCGGCGFVFVIVGDAPEPSGQGMLHELVVRCPGCNACIWVILPYSRADLAQMVMLDTETMRLGSLLEQHQHMVERLKEMLERPADSMGIEAIDSLPELSMGSEQGSVKYKCPFCNATYAFSPDVRPPDVIELQCTCTKCGKRLPKYWQRQSDDMYVPQPREFEESASVTKPPITGTEAAGFVAWLDQPTTTLGDLMREGEEEGGK